MLNDKVEHGIYFNHVLATCISTVQILASSSKIRTLKGQYPIVYLNDVQINKK